LRVLGISTFGDTPNEVGPDYLHDLFQHALSVIPPDEVANTPIFLLATAGMRFLPRLQQKALLEQVCRYARETTKFMLPDCDLHIKVIPGETEGLYGWIAANYLLGGFDKPGEHDHGKGHHTYGFLDMGGASAQIAFAPNATETEKHANDLTLLRMRTLDGKSSEYKVFVTTWLGFGVNKARKRYVDSLLAASPEAMELPDPCLPSGLNVTISGEPIKSGSEEELGKAPHLLGTGDFTGCLSATLPLLEKDKPCPDKPCLIGGVHVPAIDFDVNHFVGVSEYWHTTHEVFEMSHKDKAYDFHTYQERVLKFCSQDWTDIKKGVDDKTWGKKVDETTALEVCFKASWLINILHEGIGVPRVGLEPIAHGHNGTKEVLEHAKEKGYLDPFQAVNKINDVEVSWTLGKMVLYASSEIQASPNTLAVGFGANEPGIPHDFQYAGGTYTPLSDAGKQKAGGGDGGDDNDWHDSLFRDSPRRIPGLLLFLLVVAVALFLLCGRERRKALVHRFLPSSRRRRPFVGKLFGLHSSPVYERVLESGDPGDGFELADLEDEEGGEHSDESDASGSGGSGSGGRVGRTSGWATPSLKAGFEAAPGASAYFDTNPVTAGQGLGLSPPSVFGRGGLISRTESRERLPEKSGIGAGTGHRSRAGSPSRMRMSPLVVGKEFVD
jgi:Golgi nucleoside diphosphatase